MKNKKVGLIIGSISLVMFFIIFIFNNALKKIHALTCDMGNSCPASQTINIQTGISLGLALIIFIIGLSIMFTKPKEKIVIKKVKERKKRLNLENLEQDEKEVVNLLLKEGKAMFQADLMDKLKIGKVKTTRLLDKLESKQFIERKRRGMNNIVVLKE